MQTEASDIINELKGLQAHCTTRPRSLEEAQRWMADYVDDLLPLPISAIKQACKEWRQSGESKFPTIGQLLSRARSAERAAQTGSTYIGSPDDNRPWAPATETEYAAMTLREKIREHRILAAELRRRAGPQKCAPEDMPIRWHTLKAEATAHDDQARDLYGKLKYSQERRIVAEQREGG